MSSPSFGMWMKLLREIAGQTRSGFSLWPTCLVGVQLNWRDEFGQGCQLGSPLAKRWWDEQSELAKTVKFVSGFLPSLNRKRHGKEYRVEMKRRCIYCDW